MPFARSAAVTGLLVGLVLAAVGAGDAYAQQIYRIVGPDGRVTFSDKPPTDGAATQARTVNPRSAGDITSLPFELREAATRYPVTLYTAPDCNPCINGRGMLLSRGIPYAERTVTTNEDIEALKRLAGTSSVPFLTIGGQRLSGFSETEWAQFLDAAGYPKTSQLPSTYVRAPAAPLVAVREQPAPTAAAPAAPAAAPLPPVEAAPAPDNPNAIRF